MQTSNQVMVVLLSGLATQLCHPSCKIGQNLYPILITSKIRNPIMNSYFLNELRYITFFGSFLVNLKSPAEVVPFSILLYFSNVSLPLLGHENILLASDFTYTDTVYTLHIKSLFMTKIHTNLNSPTGKLRAMMSK